MNAIKDMRNKLSLTQEQMAKCLGISRAMVGHCETGTKQLSTKALFRLSKMEMMLVKGSKKREVRLKAEDKLMNDHYEKSRKNPDPKLRLHAGRTAKMHRTLIEMKIKYHAVESQLEITKRLLEQTEKGHNKETVFLRVLEENLFQKLIKITPLKQLALKAKIMGRITEYEVLNGMYEG